MNMRVFASAVSVFLGLTALFIPVSAQSGGDSHEAGGALADSSLIIPVPNLPGTRSDDRIFAEICGCLSGRVKIRRDAPDFLPVAWSVRTLDGRSMAPRDENRSGAIVTLDMTSFEPGIYLVSLRDKNGRTITRPLNIR
jgi:hypothetical protein